MYKGKKYDKGSSLTDIYRKAIRLYGSYLMEMAKVVGSSQPADAQRQAILDLDNWLFHPVKKMECTYVKENLLETRNNLLYPHKHSPFFPLPGGNESFPTSALHKSDRTPYYRLFLI